MTKKLQNYRQSLNKTAQILAMSTVDASVYDTAYSTMSREEAINDYRLALWALPRAKVFEVSPTLTKMLLNTDNTVYPTRLPFSPMFIECELGYDLAWINESCFAEHQKYLGLLLLEGDVLSKNTKFGQLSHLVMDGKELLETPYPNIYIYAVTEDEKGIGHIRISLYKEYTDSGARMDGHWEEERDYIRKFVMNFLDFLNDPCVEVVRVLRSDRSVRKAVRKRKKPKFLRPSNIVRVTGKLKIYIDSLQKHVETHTHFSHRFWVRGHWRHLKSKYYRNMRGRKVWIPPFIKGEGVLVLNKRYFAHQPLPKRRPKEDGKNHNQGEEEN